MPVIGTFKADKDGYAGTIRTLSLNAKLRIVANDQKQSASAPDFRVFVGVTEGRRRLAQDLRRGSVVLPACAPRRSGLSRADQGGADREERRRRPAPAVAAREKRQRPVGLTAPLLRLQQIRGTRMAAWRPFVLMLLPFAAGYYFSYVFRTINALIAGTLTRELGLGPADLGLLTSVYFLAMAAVQVPLGILLDRYGPRRVQSACLVFAAAGAGVFACAESMPGLMLGRALIGVGVATALMASLKAIVLWFPKERIALANGWVVMLGALGAVTATLPAEPLVRSLGWRGPVHAAGGGHGRVRNHYVCRRTRNRTATGRAFISRETARHLPRCALSAARAAIDPMHRHGLVAAGIVGRTMARARRRP